MGLLLELALPTALSAAALLVFAGTTRHWDLRTPLGLSIFGILLVVLSLVLSVQLDRLTLAGRTASGRPPRLNPPGPRWRSFKFLLGGVLIPLATLAAANLVHLPNHETPLAMAIRLRLPHPGVSRAEQLASAVLRAPTPAAKARGILALEGMRSDAGLDQLLRVLSEDPAALKDGSEYQSLSAALASYGADARARLLPLFDEIAAGARKSATPPVGDLYDRYFSADFDGLAHEIARDGSARTDGRADRITALRGEMQHALLPLESDSATAEASAGLPAFILHTLLQMDLKDDETLRVFARKTAADDSWSDAIRGQALLLTAKVGNKDDLDELFGYLDSPSPLLQARAMQAIAALESKLSASAGR